MSNIWFCVIAAAALLFSVGSAEAGENTFPPPQGFGAPPAVAEFMGDPYTHPRMGYYTQITPVSRVCRVGGDIASKCWLRQYEPVGADCGCPPRAYGEPIRFGEVSRF